MAAAIFVPGYTVRRFRRTFDKLAPRVSARRGESRRCGEHAGQNCDSYHPMNHNGSFGWRSARLAR